MTNTFSPSEIQEITGITPESLRDWRRRGFLGGVGHILLPDGKTTSRIEDATAAGISRPAWVYALGDAVVLAIAKSLGSLTNDLFAQIQLAMQLAPYIVEFSNIGTPLAALVDNRFAIAWRESDEDLAFQCIRLNNLSNIKNYKVAHAIFIDMQREAELLPPQLIERLAQIGGAE